MAGEDEAGAETDVAPVRDDECLLRLVWSSLDVVDGELQPTAIVSGDLAGPERGISVDRCPMAKRNIVTALADYQRRNAKNEGDRDDAHVSELSCGAVRALLDPETSEALCVVEASPTMADPDRGLLANPAHAHIASRTKRSRSKIKQLQLLLLPLLGRPCALNRYRFADE